MTTKSQHPTKIAFDCPEDKRIMGIENDVKTVKGDVQSVKGDVQSIIDKMDTVCETMDDLTHKFNDALFPSDMHPENGLINTAHINKRDIVEIKKTLKKYEDAKIIANVEFAKSEITKAKIWVAAAVSIGVVVYTVFTYLLDIYMKSK